MENISYEEYMRRVLGYTPLNCNSMEDTYEVNNYYGIPTNPMNTSENYQNVMQLEKFYPEVYHKVYPLVCKECRLNTMPITQECIERMTDNVCKAMELDLKVETNVKIEVRKEENRNTRPNETRQSNNALRDLIKILILRELIAGGIGNRPPFPPRPPMPPQPPRSPFPGPGGRPPFPGGPMPR